MRVRGWMWIALAVPVAGCTCGKSPAELPPGDAAPHYAFPPTPSEAGLDAGLDAASATVTLDGPVDRTTAQKIAYDFAEKHWKRYRIRQTTALYAEHNGNYHVLVEFYAPGVVATVIVRPADGSIDDAGIAFPDGATARP